MEYYLGWIALVAVSLWASVVAFIWALKNGQFSDQGRARYLPLTDEVVADTAGNPARMTREVYAMLIVVAIGLTGMLAAIVLALMHWKG